MNKNLVIWHINKYCTIAFIALVFLGVNHCIFQYSIAFLATIAIAIVLSAIANALISI